jgi:hypothetical protein
MRRDILFFVKGVPQELFVGDSHYFLASITGNAQQIAQEIREKFPEFDIFVRTKPDFPLLGFGFRHESEDLAPLLHGAHRQVSGLVDGYSLITDEPPRFSDLILVREGHDDHALIQIYRRQGWAFCREPQSSGMDQWRARNEQMLRRLLHFFDVVAEDPSAPMNDLRSNLLNAARMFRHGAASQSTEIEFLAKFSALECLVCGSERHGREALLQSKLTKLFNDDAIVTPDRVSRLWELRCSWSHQARPYATSADREVYPPGAGTLHVERLFAGVVCFALDNADFVETLDELWRRADSYTIPELVASHRPPACAGMAIEEAIIDTNLRVRAVGPLFDGLYGTKAKGLVL